jgi:hypothetical protein
LPDGSAVLVSASESLTHHSKAAMYGLVTLGHNFADLLNAHLLKNELPTPLIIAGVLFTIALRFLHFDYKPVFIKKTVLIT